MVFVKAIHCVGETKDGECGNTFYVPLDSDKFSCCCPFCGAELDLTLTLLDGVSNEKYELKFAGGISEFDLTPLGIAEFYQDVEFYRHKWKQESRGESDIFLSLLEWIVSSVQCSSYKNISLEGFALWIMSEHLGDVFDTFFGKYITGINPQVLPKTRYTHKELTDRISMEGL